ncbi:MAG: response regulator [Proteobacteria bacterium]|jgi:DNA-binding response OmpR family regulator|nr:response regulator [Pseudomonadota bacterium]
MKKILVVEDYESLRLLYHDVLAEAGYEVILAANGKEALKQLDKAKPDLIVMDIVMPMMDGMEALGRIIRKDGRIPIILNTAYSSYRDDFMSWGADAFVVKSADLEELKAKVREILEGAEGLENNPLQVGLSSKSQYRPGHTSNSRG